MTQELPKDNEISVSETLETSKRPEQVTQEKITAREEFIRKLTTLLSMAFDKCAMDNPGRAGIKGQQKWFSVAASLAQTLARLVSDLEYEKMQMTVDAMKKRVLEANVHKRIAFSQSRPRLDRQERTEQ